MIPVKAQMYRDIYKLDIRIKDYKEINHRHALETQYFSRL